MAKKINMLEICNRIKCSKINLKLLCLMWLLLLICVMKIDVSFSLVYKND